MDNEIVLATAPGVARRLTNDGREKFFPTLSPDGSLVVYHEKYDYYGWDRVKGERVDVPMVVLEVVTGRDRCRGRGIPSVDRQLLGFEWLGNRWILVHGEHKRFVDASTCIASDDIWGHQFQSSPAREKVAFVYGYVPKHFWQEEPSWAVGLAELAQELGRETWIWHPIYPKFSTATYPDEEWREVQVRHRFNSFFVWDAASRRLAFIEETMGRFWLICLDVEPFSRSEPPIVLLQEAIDIKRAVDAAVIWDGDTVTVKNEHDGSDPDWQPREWKFCCPQAGSVPWTAETWQLTPGYPLLRGPGSPNP